ncbi:substrate-binding domain-containing protein [Pedobacter faecalis]|uniref:substrate-binding domain-containing protein n=1 Tax=Pedobacter faecalis TaxID=3041495 RepID=UPI00254A7822|nr:substrate-binding domain-containing protein [Pedobacter sp. ELA7]
MRYLNIILAAIVFVSCTNAEKSGSNEQTRTSGTVKILVDESFSSIIADQIEVFTSDYKDAHFIVRSENEQKIIPAFLNDTARVLILSRMLRTDEEAVYKKKGVVPKVSRFAIDGIALITQSGDVDSNITVEEVIRIFKGASNSGKNLVFDNAYSSTLRYFKELSGVNDIPKEGVYTLKDNNDVIKYIADNKNYIGVVGVNWLIGNNPEMSDFIAKVKMMGVKNMQGKVGDDAFYKPIQTNLISGVYPFLRNVYVIDAEGKNGLGAGFANWLVSQRGQLIVLRAGLGPHKMVPREFNLKNTN